MYAMDKFIAVTDARKLFDLGESFLVYNSQLRKCMGVDNVTKKVPYENEQYIEPLTVVSLIMWSSPVRASGY